jgi:hypothetical protein
MVKSPALTSVLVFGLATLVYAANTASIPLGTSMTAAPLTATRASLTKARYKHGHPKGRKAIARKPVVRKLSPSAN